MTFAEFDEFTETFLKEVRKMKDTKGKEYANTTDRFDNFNRLALKNDVGRLVVANIYMTKHLDAIDSYIKTGREHSSEPIRGRFIDAVTYLILMAGMQDETKPTPPHVEYVYPLGVRYLYKGDRLYGARDIILETNSIVVLQERQDNSALVSWNTTTFVVRVENLCPYLPKT